MPTTRLRAVVALVFAAGAASLSACGGSDNGPSFASTIDSASATAAAEDAASFASDVGSAIVEKNTFADIGSLLPAKGVNSTTYAEQLLANIRATAYRRAHRSAPQGSHLASPNFSATFSECHPNVTGIDGDSIPIDSDDNGVPDDLKITFPANCIESDSAGTFTTQWSGSVELKDLGGLYAYRMDVGNLKVKSVETASGNFEQFAVNGLETATYTTSSISHRTGLSYSLSFSGPVAAPPAPGASMSSAASVGSVTFDYNETSAYDPDGTISLADPIPSGDLSFTLDYRILASATGQQDQNFRFTMNTSTALHYDNETCYDVVSGTIHGLLNSNANIGFDVGWTGCDTYTVTTFGTTESTS